MSNKDLSKITPRIHDHLFNRLSGGNEAKYNYLVNNLAYIAKKKTNGVQLIDKINNSTNR
jgi:hypothetical protein